MERYVQTSIEWATHVALWAVGILIGIGKLLADEKEYPIKSYIGHGIISGGIASAAGSVMLLIPDAPEVAVIGLASAFATIGTVAMRELAIKYLGRKANDK